MKFSYQVEESTIIVSSRPKSLSQGADRMGAEPDAAIDPTEQADAYMSVTDTFCSPPTGGQPFVWIPWNEGRKPHPELYYAANRALIWWVHYEKRKRIILFCDGGTHRSVTIFGAFLLTYFKKDAQKICEARENVGKVYPADDKDTTHWAQPLEYVEGYLDEFPADRLLLRAMGKDYLSRLDNHTKGIYEMVKERYGNHR